MAVTLRLSRGGSKKRPFFRIVAADVRAPRDGRYLERLGTYNPMKKKDDPERITLNKERIQHWISVGARPSLRVTKFLALQGLAEKPVIPKQTKQPPVYLNQLIFLFFYQTQKEQLDILKNKQQHI